MAKQPRDTRGVIEWSTPPVAAAATERRPQRPWALIASELRARPGEWGLIDDRCENQRLHSRIVKGESWWGPPGSFEVKTRFRDGRMCVWARYVG